MKIAHVTQFLGVGGLEKIIYHLALEQMALGHEVIVYVYDYEQSWTEFFQNSGIKVVNRKKTKTGYDFELIKMMNKDLMGFDIINMHDLNPLMYLAPLTFFKKLTFQKWPTLIHTTHTLEHIGRMPHYKWYEKILTIPTKKIICVSEKIQSFYLNDLKKSKKQVCFIPNGIAIYKSAINSEYRLLKKQWLCDKHGLDINLPIIVSISRIVPLKDQKFLVENLKELGNIQLVVVGPASDQKYFDELKKSESSLIRIVGGQTEIYDYSLGADIYVSASTHEGIPVSVLEAMAVETPCLVTEIPGHLILNKHEKVIELFSLQNKEEFKSKLIKMLDNKLEFQRLGKAAREVVEKYFSVSKMVSEYMSVYKGKKDV